jgi:DNA-binding transcriptional ArsR family regulator
MGVRRDANSDAPADAGPFRLPDNPTAPDLVAKYFRGLGDPTRLRILELLRGAELSVGQLVDALGLGQSKVSNHLACLRWCGFVDSRREHRIVYYRIADERVEHLLDLGHALLFENEEHVRACGRIDGEADSRLRR